jgi:hypothetical protein
VSKYHVLDKQWTNKYSYKLTVQKCLYKKREIFILYRVYLKYLVKLQA